MKISRVVIIGSGNIETYLLNEINSGDFIISVDRAALNLIKIGIIPDIAIGDFDSVSDDDLVKIEKYAKKVLKYNSKKDETDLELAIIYSIGLSPDEVIIWGATGKRLDHELANIYLLKKYLNSNIKASIADANNKITLIDKKTIIDKDKAYKYLSLIPYTEEAVITISGCKYNVSKRALLKGSSLGVSNEILDNFATIDIHKGIVILISSRD